VYVEFAVNGNQIKRRNMKLHDLLNEKLLAGEFQFGFELEAILGDDQALNAFETDRERRRYIEKVFANYFDAVPAVKGDSSIEPDDESHWTFEWPSPVMEFTPEYISATIKLLENLSSMGIYTNNTCGFHVHISFPSITPQDAAWLVYALALDPTMQKAITYFKQYNFYDFDYADDTFLGKIEGYHRVGQLGSMYNLFNTDKYNSIRIHPQGTLEWRGPREFLNTGNKRIIKDFFLLLYRFIKWMSNTIQRKEIGGIKRIDFDKNIPTSTKFNKIQRNDRWSEKMDLTTLPKIFKIAPWLAHANFENAYIEYQPDDIVWLRGIWYDGTWKGGTWKGGTWKGGTWEDGIWHDGIWKNGTWRNGRWYNGTWEDGIWEFGTWRFGRWFDGIWKSGFWYNGFWKSGTWENGFWKSGTWENGIWKRGVWKGGSWIKGDIQSQGVITQSTKPPGNKKEEEN
jgi:hypothetical protein